MGTMTGRCENEGSSARGKCPNELRNALQGAMFIENFRFLDHSRFFWVVETVFLEVARRSPFMKEPVMIGAVGGFSAGQFRLSLAVRGEVF